MSKPKKHLALALILWGLIALPALTVFAQAPGIGSPGAALYHTVTKQFLFEKNGDTPMFPASTTKILTALIILEENQLSDQVVVPSNFRNPGGSSIAIDHGEVFTVEQLLYATLVKSANDAALVLALHNSGTQEAFAEKMNTRATEIGAINTHFVNPHGLHHKDQYTTAKDLALIATLAMKNETFRKMVSTSEYSIPPTNKKSETRDYLRTSNRFLRDTGIYMNYKGDSIPIYDPEVEGIKTGYTTEANNCLVSSKAIDGGRLISVILGAGVDNLVYTDSKALLDYGLSGFAAKRFVTAGQVVTNIKVEGAKDTGLDLVAKDTLLANFPADAQNPTAKRDIQLLTPPKGDIKKGTVLGKVTYSFEDKTLASTDLLAARDITTKDLVGDVLFALDPNWQPFAMTQKSAINLAVKGAIGLVIWRWIVVTLQRRRKKKARQAKLREIRASIAQEETAPPQKTPTQRPSTNLVPLKALDLKGRSPKRSKRK